MQTAQSMNQSKVVAIPSNLLKAREKSRVQVEIGFGFSSHWLINCREIFQPITKCSNCNREITFDSHFKTAPWVTNGIISKVLRHGLCWFHKTARTNALTNTQAQDFRLGNAYNNIGSRNQPSRPIFRSSKSAGIRNVVYP